MPFILPKRLRAFRVFRQHDAMDCGPSCLRMIAEHHGRHFSLVHLRSLCGMTRQGISLLGLCEAAEDIGLKPTAAMAQAGQLPRLPCPFIVWWNQNHFVVVYRVDKRFVRVADPALGRVRYSHSDFIRSWTTKNAEGQRQGAILLLQPTPKFYEKDGDAETIPPFQTLWRHGIPYKSLLRSAVIAFGLSLVAGALIPLLSQSLIDEGVSFGDFSLIIALGIAQLGLYLGRTAFMVVEHLSLVHLGGRVSLSVVSHFLAKLLRMPVRFFETIQVGDVLTRVGDHRRIDNFLTSSVVRVPGSLVYAAMLMLVTFLFSPLIAGIVVAGAVVILVTTLMLERRRMALDRLRFTRESESQTKLLDAIHGLRDLKLANAEQPYRWDWESVQVRLFDIELREARIAEAQEMVAGGLSDLMGVAVSIVAALQVVQGHMTLGALMATLFILGQTTTPFRSLPGFFRQVQDVRLALDRVAVISQAEDETQIESQPLPPMRTPEPLNIRNLSFRYGERSTPWTLDNLSFDVPAGSVCAIVGPSGSGKTTLISLLMKHFEPDEGHVFIGNQRLGETDARAWRSHCGAVLQDGHIFAGTIAENIALGEQEPDLTRVREAAEIAQASEFIQGLPLGYRMRIGADGVKLSGGQAQRILIARAIYRSPLYLFFDEATSALDANSEAMLQRALQRFFRGRTVFVVAHRLSTVRHADQIIVLEAGKIVEHGHHEDLVRQQGRYFNLVRNQLELAA